MKLIIKVFFCVFLFIQLLNVKSMAQNTIIHIAGIYDNLIAPVRMAFDKDDNLYVTDNKQKSIVKYDASGMFSGKIPLEFTPISIAADKNNRIFVGDAKSGNIYKTDAYGNTSLFYEGCAYPVSLEFSPDGLLYVVDSKLLRVIVLDAVGKLVKTIGEGVLVYPTSIACDGKNKRILVTEHGGLGTGFKPECKIRVFDLSGNYLTDFGSYGNEDGEFYRIADIGIGKCGNIYVCDSYQGTVSIFDEDFNFIRKFGTYGNKAGELNLPLDIAFNLNRDIFISSINNGSVEIFNMTDSLPTSDVYTSASVLCPGKQSDVVFSFTGTPPWNFIYTVDGKNPVSLTTSENPYVLTVSDPGIYEITQLSDANSSGTCFSGAAVISEYKQSVSVSVSTETPDICEQDTAIIRVDLTGTPPWYFSYTLNSENSQNVITEESPYYIYAQEGGKYQLTYFSDNYCESDTLDGTDITVFEKSVPDFDFTENGLEISFLNTTLFAESYFWDFGDGTTSTEINPVHIFENDGVYVVNLTSSNTVCNENSINKEIDISSLSIPESADDKKLSIYPNPSNGIFTVEINNTEKTDILLVIVSLTGEIVFSDVFQNGETFKQIDLKNISAGIYTVKVKSKKYSETLKLVLSN